MQNQFMPSNTVKPQVNRSCEVRKNKPLKLEKYQDLRDAYADLKAERKEAGMKDYQLTPQRLENYFKAG